MRLFASSARSSLSLLVKGVSCCLRVRNTRPHPTMAEAAGPALASVPSRPNPKQQLALEGLKHRVSVIAEQSRAAPLIRKRTSQVRSSWDAR